MSETLKDEAGGHTGNGEIHIMSEEEIEAFITKHDRVATHCCRIVPLPAFPNGHTGFVKISGTE